MDTNQLKRYEKLAYEPIYLLDVLPEENGKVVFQVSGSTANVYKVAIYFGDQKNIYCSCPDNTVHCKRVGCVCKHCCFVLCKVLRIFNTDSAFFSRLKFNDSEEQAIRDAIKKVNLVNSDYINKELRDLYKDTSTPKDREELYKQKRETTEDDLCAICYDEFKEKNNVECPACHNVMHQGCIEKWLSMGKNTCVYCRSEVWKNYGKTAATTTSGKYKNLRD